MFRELSFLGSTKVVFLVSAIAALLAARRCPRLAIAIVVIALARPATEFLLKELVSRDRPIGNRLVGGEGYSFPSGHPLATAASWGTLPLVAALYTKRRVLWWAIAIGVWTIVVLVAMSRVWLGVHWASDVIAAIALAVIGVALAERYVVRSECRCSPVTRRCRMLITSARRLSIVQSSRQPVSCFRFVSSSSGWSTARKRPSPSATIGPTTSELTSKPAGEQQRLHHLRQGLAGLGPVGLGVQHEFDPRVRVDPTVRGQRRFAQRQHAEHADREAGDPDDDLRRLHRHVRPEFRSSLRSCASSAPGTSWVSTVTWSTTMPPGG